MQEQDEKNNQLESDRALALKIAKEQVAYLQIPMSSEFKLSEVNPNSWWSANYEEVDQAIIVQYLFNDLSSTVIGITLNQVVFRVIREARRVMTTEKATLILLTSKMKSERKLFMKSQKILRCNILDIFH